MDLRKPDFKETTASAQKAIGSVEKSKNIIPVEVRVFLKEVPNVVIVAIVFLVAESLVGIGFTIYYLWQYVIGVIIFFAIWLSPKKWWKSDKKNKVKNNKSK